MWTVVLNWLGGLLGGPFAKAAVEAYKAKLDAGNNTDKIAADLAGQAAALAVREQELATQIITAEQGRWYTAMIRPLFAAPFIVFTWKVVVFDKVMGWGSTDALAGDVSTWAGYIILAYFGGRSLEKIAGIAVSRFGR